MSHVFFEHTPASVAVDFAHQDHDWLDLGVHISGGATRVTEMDEHLRCVDEYLDEEPVERILMRLSGAQCPFRNLLAWLEAG